MENFYTIEEIAKILKLNRQTIYTMIKKGKIKAVRIGFQFRVYESELKRLSEEGGFNG